ADGFPKGACSIAGLASPAAARRSRVTRTRHARIRSRDPRCLGSRGLAGFALVDVAVREAAVGAVLLEALHRLGFLLPLRLAVDAETGEGQSLETAFRDVRLAALADAVAAIVDAGEGIVDRLQLVPVPVGQDQVDLAVAGVAGEV